MITINITKQHINNLFDKLEENNIHGVYIEQRCDSGSGFECDYVNARNENGDSANEALENTKITVANIIKPLFNIETHMLEEKYEAIDLTLKDLTIHIAQTLMDSHIDHDMNRDNGGYGSLDIHVKNRVIEYSVYEEVIESRDVAYNELDDAQSICDRINNTDLLLVKGDLDAKDTVQIIGCSRNYSEPTQHSP